MVGASLRGGHSMRRIAWVGLRHGRGTPIWRLRLPGLWWWTLGNTLGRTLLWRSLCPGWGGTRRELLTVGHALSNRCLGVCRLNVRPLGRLAGHPRSGGGTGPGCRQWCTCVASRGNLRVLLRERLWLLLLWRRMPVRCVRLLCSSLSHVCNSRLTGMLRVMMLLLLLKMHVLLLLLLMLLLLLLLLLQMELMLSGRG